MTLTALERRAGGERFAPRALVRQLKQVDPLAECIYIGEGVWWVGLDKPNRQNAKVGQHKVKASRRMTDVAEARRMERVGQVQQAGLVFLAEYEVQGDPDGRLARDLTFAEWMERTKTLEEQQAFLNRTKAAEREQARKDLQDDGRAMDAWRYAFTRSHAVSRIDPSTRRSGWTTHRSIG